MSGLSSVIADKKISYIDYDDIKKLSSDDLIIVRVEAIEALSSLDNRIMFIDEDMNDVSALTAVRIHLKRVLSMVNGFIKTKNRCEVKSQSNAKDRLKIANAKIISLEQKIKRMKLYIKSIEKGQ